MTLGDLIKRYREQTGATMEYTANLCGITKGYVAMLERNVNSKTGKPVKPTIETIAKVCNGLKLDIDEVFNLLDDDYEISINSTLSSRENTLINNFKKLNNAGQEKVEDYIQDLLCNSKYAANTYPFPSRIEYSMVAEDAVDHNSKK